MSKAEKAANTAENNKNKNKKPWWLLALLLLLITLTLLTSVIVVIRIGNFLPENVNVIFIVPKKASFQLGDGKEVWETESKIDLFASSYSDSEGNVNVRSEDGSDLFAPGTENEYTFTLSNTGNIAVDYATSITLELSLGEYDDLPVEMKMMRHDGSYVFGGEDEWVSPKEIGTINESGTIGASRYTTYTVLWKWDFESGDDKLDTMLGSLSASTDISMSLSVGTYAEISSKGASKDGEPIIDPKTGEQYEPYGGQTGGKFRTPYFPILLVILVLVAVIFVIGYIKTRGKAKKEGQTNAAKK